MKKILIILIGCLLTTADAEANCNCKRPSRGLPGLQGAQGDEGAQGPVGPTGPFATSTFISLSFDGSFSVSPQSVVPFNSPPHAENGNISYDSGTGEVSIIDAGVYSFTYGVTGSPSNRQIALRLNGGIVLPGSTIDVTAGVMQSASLLYTISPMTTIALINNQANNSGQSINISASSTSSQSAYLFIQRIY